MTEKRFWSDDYSVGYYTEIVDNDKELQDVPNPKKNLTIGELLDLLNGLNDENKELKKENEQLKERIKELEQEIEKLDTFKKILEYVEKDSDRVDWQSYCEKEFGGL